MQSLERLFDFSCSLTSTPSIARTMGPCIKGEKVASKVGESDSSENGDPVPQLLHPKDFKPSEDFKDMTLEIVWMNVYNMVVLHALATYGFYLVSTVNEKELIYW
eukprot:sb/3477971/